MSRPLLLCLLLCGCVAADEGVAPEGGQSAISSATWTLGWDREGTTRTKAGRTFETDLGYRVDLSEGFAISYSVTLVPCTMDVVATGPRWIRPALAHHGEFQDGSEYFMQRVEDFVDPLEARYEAAFDAADYCGVHWAIARPDADIVGQEGAPDERISLRLRGTWSRGDEGGELDYTTDWPDGRSFLFGDELPQPDVSSGHLDVRFERRLGQAFDGIELADEIEGGVLWAVLENLVGNVDVTARPGTGS